MDLSFLDGKCLAYQLVGSRITCNPPPVDTDQDVLVLTSEELWRGYLSATGVAKALNLLDKADRIMLFQAVLYGNLPVAETPPPLPIELPPIADYVRPWWLTTKQHHAGCVEALNETEARAMALEAWGVEPDTCERLPYPANPRINQYDGNPYGVCPSFCYNPGLCKGRGSCPQSPSCVD